MQHTPYGYDIVDGKAVVNEEKAGILRRICGNYLAGMSFISAAQKEGLVMSHCGVKRMMQNRRYLGDDFYPAILTEEMMQAVETERTKREKALGRDRRTRKEQAGAAACTQFSAPKIPQKYKDPVRQAEYAYSLIRNEVIT